MARVFNSSGIRKTAGALAATALAAGAMVAGAAPASADTVLAVTYPVTDASSTYINSTDSTVKLGPGEMKARLTLETGALESDLVLPPARGEFKQFGVIPVGVTITLLPTGPAVGQADPNTGAITATAKAHIKLSNLVVAGIPTPIGSYCKTETPATIPVASEAGWDVVQGGTLSGTYTIPKFEHCLLATPLINLIVPGAGNKVSLKLGPGVFPS
ncbi:hypothetical protein [Thermomonospora umbrina]|uniref:Dehydratase n=1 Tax=Thermomonospora umbrina TaxID=111806 RepID=A0A3D9SI10_9ACTN|nr:hypothetical protein [Thermomonospora umbrina]REE95549.1 hypothetical protein DFJ69_0939 [Thermomonospora umbrina]